MTFEMEMVLKIFLLDVNLLIALFDSTHVHHREAHSWFGTSGIHGFATCPITENAFVRIVSNPAYPNTNFTPEQALAHLRKFIENQANHYFWPESISLTSTEIFDHRFLQGHRQIADIYLLGMAKYHGGSLATFDSRIPFNAIKDAEKDLLTVLPA